ncbi:agmatinase [Halospeciosus flavus]|uniref:Agmatinase n=1 Tax=Halospeciosus flavus TaxID=3032283 RepID=A0ABD5Z8L4_9EURY|nr:agmatinase [Halospeciosus flavus]
MTFPGATTDRDVANFVVVGAPLDASTTFQPGTRFGPDRVRQFSRTFEDYDHRYDARFSDLGVHDHGDVRAWNDAPDYLDYLEGVVTDVLLDDAVPVLVGGEHTVSVAAVRAVDPDVFVALDAHLDLREAYDGDPYSHSTVTRHALDVADEAVVVGARSGSGSEWERAAEADVTVVEPDEAADWNPDFGERSVYCSVDVDAADPAFAPGTGTPEPGGLTSRELRSLVADLAPQSVAFDVVEVNDRDDGQAALLGGKLLRDFVFAHAEHADAQN